MLLGKVEWIGKHPEPPTLIKKKTKKGAKGIDVDQILLSNRQLFLFGEINDKLSYTIIKKLIALDKLNNKKPINLYINSPGGSCSDGFAIIDAMTGIRAPITTIITGEACSMAGIVSVAGDRRAMTVNSIWMGHDMSGGIGGDYTTKVLDRAEHLKRYQKRLEEFIAEHTNLTDKDLMKGRHGELWLDAYECLKKGVIDIFIK